MLHRCAGELKRAAVKAAGADSLGMSSSGCNKQAADPANHPPDSPLSDLFHVDIPPATTIARPGGREQVHGRDCGITQGATLMWNQFAARKASRPCNLRMHSTSQLPWVQTILKRPAIEHRKRPSVEGQLKTDSGRSDCGAERHRQPKAVLRKVPAPMTALSTNLCSILSFLDKR